MQKIVKNMGVKIKGWCVVEERGLCYRNIVPPAHAGTEWRDRVGVKFGFSKSIIGTQNCSLQCGQESINADYQVITLVGVSMWGKQRDKGRTNGEFGTLKDGELYGQLWGISSACLSSCRTTITPLPPSPFSSPA